MTTEDLRAAITAAFADPRLPARVYLLCDLRACTAAPDVDEVVERVGIMKDQQPTLAACAFAVSTPFQLGVANMYRAQSQLDRGPLIENFLTLDEAQQWLRDLPVTLYAGLMALRHDDRPMHVSH